MLVKFKNVVLNLLKVPPEPEAPAGSPGSVQVFRAAPNFYKLSLIRWGLKQLSALIAIIVALTVWHLFGDQIPSGVRHVVILHLILPALFVMFLPFTYALVWLDYQMRWYIVTDRSLRIRSGVWRVREMTMTFANIQQITIHQGPLQRLLGISDLQVTTAGGGGHSPVEQGMKHRAAESMHLGFFHGIDNAEQIRDLMLDRLRHLRDTGLGDPDEIHHEEPITTSAESPLFGAAHELLTEARALRHVLTG